MRTTHSSAQYSRTRKAAARFAAALLVAALLVAASGLVRANAAEPNAKPADVFTVLEAHCVKCHGGEKTKGGLDLVTHEALMLGGESGAAIVPGKPDASLLIHTVRHEKDPHMPHKEAKLADADIAKLVDWVKAGAPYPRALAKAAPSGAEKGPVKFTITEADRKHWAFQPIQRPPVPALKSPVLSAQSSENRSPAATKPPSTEHWAPSTNPIDAFILAKLEAADLSPSPPASPETLARRIYLDLIGLPPTPAEVDAFVQSANRNLKSAIESLVDRLLASPHYGERWGRHWLDLARFAESDGFEHDAVRPHSWRYRDYVIKAFNDDKPYDQFIREQLAGDELFANAKPETRNPDLLVATGFNLLGPDMVDSSDQVQRRHNTLNDMTDTASLAFLGLTMGCARCHDHKFEPLSQRDYYSVQAFFTPAKFARDTPIPSAEARAAFDAAMEKYTAHPKVRELADLEAPVRAAVFEKKVAKLSHEAQIAHHTPPEKRNDEQENLVMETLNKVKISEKDITHEMTDEQRARHDALAAEVKKLAKPPELPKAMTLTRGDKTAKTFVLHRGEYSQPQEEVAPGFPAVLRPPPAAVGARTALADWVASPRNPLTARVMVNRIWQHHFGRGLVATPSDFGTHGAKPTHPELLDWLASEFIARGWSVKAMHRLMLTSATYQQAAVLSAQSSVLRNDAAQSERATSKLSTDAPSTEHFSRGITTDPENKLLWRMNRLRLEGEVIRDSLLAISGQLNPSMGGPGIFPPIAKEVASGAKGGWPQTDRAHDWSRRSIYIFARRNLRFPFLEVFDAPDNNLSCPARERSTTAPQSLTLLNADEVTAAAKLTEARLMKEAATNDERIAVAYRLVLGRPPSAKEQELASDFLKLAPLNELCRALFNLNDFVYAE